MKRQTLLAVVLGVALVTTGFLFVRRSGTMTCGVCARKVCPAMTFGLRTRWGRAILTCCPHCGLEALEHHPDYRAAFATDFATGKRIPAKEAVYVRGSDVQLCHRPEGRPVEMAGEVAYTAYDRCLPSLVAFADRREADSFRKKHGGAVLSLSF